MNYARFTDPKEKRARIGYDFNARKIAKWGQSQDYPSASYGKHKYKQAELARKWTKHWADQRHIEWAKEWAPRRKHQMKSYGASASGRGSLGIPFYGLKQAASNFWDNRNRNKYKKIVVPEIQLAAKRMAQKKEKERWIQRVFTRDPRILNYSMSHAILNSYKK